MKLETIKDARFYAVRNRLEGFTRLSLFTDQQLKDLGKGKCGPGDGLGDLLVPDTMWGLNVTPA